MLIAYRQFAGKTIADVQAFFDSPLIASQSIGSMPKIPFQFYVFAFDTFLRSETLMTNFKTSLDGPDCFSTFLRLVLSKLESPPDDICNRHFMHRHLFYLEHRQSILHAGKLLARGW